MRGGGDIEYFAKPVLLWYNRQNPLQMKKPPEAVLRAKKILQSAKKIAKEIKAFPKLSPAGKKAYILVKITDGVRTIVILTQQ